MTGTAKQIAYAEDIKTNVLHNVAHNIELSQNRHEEYDHHPAFEAHADAFRLMETLLRAIFAKHDDAQWIIGNKGKFEFSEICLTVDRWAEQIRTGKKTIAQIAKENGLPNYPA